MGRVEGEERRARTRERLHSETAISRDEAFLNKQQRRRSILCSFTKWSHCCGIAVFIFCPIVFLFISNVWGPYWQSNLVQRGSTGPISSPSLSCVFLRWAVDSQIWSLCDDWWLVEITYRGDWTGRGKMVSRSWQSGAQPLWDQSPSYFIRQMCFSEDGRVNGTGVSCPDCCLISGGYVRGNTISRPFIHPSLLIAGHANRRETSGGDACPQWGRLVLMGGAIWQKHGLTAFKCDCGLKRKLWKTNVLVHHGPSNKNKS